MHVTFSAVLKLHDLRNYVIPSYRRFIFMETKPTTSTYLCFIKIHVCVCVS